MDSKEFSEINKENTQENIGATIEEKQQEVQEEVQDVFLEDVQEEVQEEVENDDFYLPEDENGDPIYNSEWLKKYSSISGWLGFFLFAVGAGGLISAIFNVVTIKSEDYAGNIFLMLSDIIPGICLLGIAIYTIYAFIKRKPNAVFWAKVYLILVFVTNLLASIFGEFDNTTGLNSKPFAIRGIIYAIIWFIYLCVSKNVQEVIPSSFRKISRKDWIISAAVFLVPIICFAIGYSNLSKIVDQRKENEANLLKTEISENERTDGRIIFAVPDSFSCSSEDVTADNGLSIKVFNIDKEDKCSGTICSDYDTDISQENFNNYRMNWRDPTLLPSDENLEYSGSKQINNNTCFYRIVSYDVNNVRVLWRYYMLFNKQTEKVAVISLYDNGEDTTYVDNLLKSIRF